MKGENHPAARPPMTLNAVEKVVISSTLQQAGWHNSRVVAGGPAAAVRQLRKQEGGDIIVLASASVIRNLLEAGEMDRLSITLCPELVGGAARLFDTCSAAMNPA